MKRDDRLQDPDGDAGQEGPRERHHPGDDRGREGSDQGGGPEVVEVLGGSGLAGQQGERERRQPTGDGPDRGGDGLGADAREAGEVGVLGRRLHGLAERRPVEQPTEPAARRAGRR